MLRPMLAVSAEPFDSPEFLYEVKWDGYRALAYLEEKTTILSRRLSDLTGAFPELTGLHERVVRRPAVLDGEIVVLAEGRPSFARLQARAGSTERPGPVWPAVFVAFDVLYAGGAPVINRPLLERKDMLRAMVSPDDRIILSQYITKDGVAFYLACVGQGLEGVMAKRLAGTYRPGRRSSDWRKFRHTREVDLVICGYQPGRGGRNLGSLLLAGRREGEYVYAGRVGTGFSEQEAQALLAKLKPLEIGGPAVRVPQKGIKGARWVRPFLVCAVTCLAATAQGCLRHPVYRGLRPDKDPGEVQAVEGGAGHGGTSCPD